MPQSQRVNPRIVVDDDFHSIAAGPGGDSIRVRLLNISRCGAAVVAPKPLGRVNSGFIIRLSPEPETPVLRLPCRIRYLLGEHVEGYNESEPQWLHGTQFGDLCPQALTFLLRYIAQRIPEPAMLEAAQH